MYSERKGFLQIASSAEGRIALIGTALAFIHCAGLVMSLYFLITSYLYNQPDDPYTHLCTDALLCILFRFGPEKDQTGQTTTAMAGQLLFSLLAVTVNLVLVWAALGHKPAGLIFWLVVYLLNILGCLVLTGIITATILHRHQYYGDIKLDSLCWLMVPLVLGILYAVVWVNVLFFLHRIRREQRNIFSIED